MGWGFDPFILLFNNRSWNILVAIRSSHRVQIERIYDIFEGDNRLVYLALSLVVGRLLLIILFELFQKTGVMDVIAEKDSISADNLFFL